MWFSVDTCFMLQTLTALSDTQLWRSNRERLLVGWISWTAIAAHCSLCADELDTAFETDTLLCCTAPRSPGKQLQP
jgi:hypothetical protein